ncbi:MAG: BolA family protein [Sphingomonadales bacterium]
MNKPSGMKVADSIRARLTGALAPVALDIVDESHKHKGHAGYREGGESHFHVTVVSDAFAGESRVARQRRVHAILADALAGPVHALSLKLMTPDEAGAQQAQSKQAQSKQER